MHTQTPVVVIGSANLDLVVSVPRLPVTGETMLSTGAERHVGGKGLNQALASSLAGRRYHLVRPGGRRRCR